MSGKLFSTNITQKELAEVLGVSQMTISRALNNRPGVSRKLQKKILLTMHKYGYVPDYIASSLRKKSANVIGLVVPDVSGSFFPEITKIIENSAKKHGFNIILSHSRESYAVERAEINLLRGFRVRGFVIAPAGNQKQFDVYQELQKRRIPLVFIDRMKKKIDCSYVVTDAESGALQVGRYLLKKAYKKWGYLRGPKGVFSSESHRKGLYASLKESGRSTNSIISVTAGFEEKDGYRAVQKLMSKAKLDVIIAINDLVAVGAYRFLKEMGIRVPQDVALVGFSDLKFMDILEIPLTTVRENITEIGQKAIEILLYEIAHPENAVQKVLIEPEIVIRQSA